MTGKISKTLLQKLFIAPNLDHNRHAYLTLFPSMFPDRQDFENFLNSTRHEDQVVHAKRILLRLALDASLPPTNRLLLNLLDFESHLSGHPAQGFIGRDHFVHLVHLYLLGLYIFWYHAGLNKILRRHFGGINQRNPLSFEKIKRDSIQVFLSTWRNFVLFHDVFYPLEIAGSALNAGGHIRPLGKVHKNLEKELALCGLARLVAFHILLEEQGAGVCFDQCYPDGYRQTSLRTPGLQGQLFHESPFASVRVENWLHAKRLPTALGPSDLTFLETVFGADNILIVVERMSDARPIWMMELGPRVELELFGDLPPKVKEGAHEFIASIRERDVSARRAEDYEVVFFANNFDKALSRTHDECLGTSANSSKDILSLARDYSQSDPTFFSWIASHKNFDAFVYHTYLTLLRDLDYAIDDNEAPGLLSQLNQRLVASKRAVKSLEKRVVRELVSHVSVQLKRRSDQLLKEGIMLSNQELPKYVGDLLQPFSDSQKQGRLFASRMSAQLRRQIDIDSRLHSLFRAVRAKIAESFSLAEDDWGSNPKECQDIVLRKWTASPSKMWKRVCDRFQSESDLKSKLLKAYRPEFVDDGVAYVDHGIGAALLACKTADLMLDAWKAASRNTCPNLRILQIATMNRNHDDETILFEEAIYAILVHNLYPEHLPSEAAQSFRTKLRTNPFAYFAMLCDSLQPWDRKRLTNPAYVDGSFGSTADKFDIDIRGDTIYIFESGHGLNISDRLNSLKRYLDTYLENASLLIKLQLAEFQPFEK